MRRAAFFLTALTTPALLAATGLAGPAVAGAPSCPVVDGRLIAQAPEGTEVLYVAVGTEVSVIADGFLVCRAPTADVVGAQLSDLDAGVTTWGVNYPGSLPGPIDVANDAADTVDLNTSGGAETITAGAARRLRVDDGSGVTRIRLEAVPTPLRLGTQGGRDVVDLTTGSGWSGDVVVDATHGVGRAAPRGGVVDDIVVRLGSGDDDVRTVDGDDLVATGGGRDRVRSQGGVDEVSLGAGADVAHPGAGRDRVDGGRGADRIRAEDTERDVVDGGPGRDGATWDAVDVRRSVEFRLR